MSLFELIILAIGLAMDAFAVAMCKGLALKRASVGQMSVVGAWFGGFQAIMPIIGFFLGISFYNYIENFDHWIAFILLAIIGANMLREAIFGDGDECECGCGCGCDDLSFKKMLIMAIATSIDALAVGISLAMAGANIWVAAILIGAITFSLSAVGVKIGSIFGARFKKKAEIFGGIVLVCIGLKILLEHLGVIGF